MNGESLKTEIDTVGFFLSVILRWELRASHLQSRCSTDWATTPTLIALVVLEIGSPAWIKVLLIYTSHFFRDDRHVPPILGFLHCHDVSQTFLPIWTGIVILFISISCAAVMTGTYQCPQLLVEILHFHITHIITTQIQAMWTFLEKLKIKLVYDPAIWLLDIYQKEYRQDTIDTPVHWCPSQHYSP
jgi:hypothetical protein